MEKQDLLTRYRAALKTRFTDLLNDEIYECEHEIAALKVRENQLHRALASEKLTSYQDFRSRSIW
jgi:hypothetical protein